MPSPATPDVPLRGVDDLLAPFEAAQKPREQWRIGTEAEKFGVLATAKPAPFDAGVAEVLAALVERHGWIAQREYADRPVIALRRGAANITLEPGAQLELSGAPLDTIHQTREEFAGHMAEAVAAGHALGIRWITLGFRPFARQADLPWVPKLRYAVMREYLPTRGARGLDMMRRTATVQANLDYANADDAFEKLRIALRVQPIVSAMFANAPYYEGRDTGHASHRLDVWGDVDPDRTGLLVDLWDGPASYARYVEWALDAPMFLVLRAGQVHRNTGQTFRAFMKDGFEGLRATQQDWETHLNTLFPEARLKRTLEMRGADGQSQATLTAVPALWKGLLYDDEARAQAASLASKITPEALREAQPAIAREALRAPLQGRPVAEWASDLLGIAESGLRRLGNLDAAGDDEGIHLSPMRALLDLGHCPADALRARVGATPSLDALREAGVVYG